MQRWHAMNSLLVGVLLLPGLVSGCDPTDRLPDLRVAPLYSFDLETTSSGRLRLRFGTIGWNVGEGPIEARGRRIDPNDRVMRVTQRVYDSSGGHRDRATSAVMIYETGDNHDHWHTRQFMTVKLYTRGQPGENVYGMRKIGYCLLDAERMSDPPPGSPDDPGYPDGSCGNSTSQTVRTGLSIGYGDDYPPNYAHQWMDITGLRRGTYRICATVDPLGEFLEQREGNNQRRTDVAIDPSAGTVRVIGAANEPCGPEIS